MRLHRPAAARAAIADREKATQHRVLEKGVVNMTAFVLGRQDVNRLLGRDPTRTTCVMFRDKTGKGLAYDKTDVQRLTRIGARRATRTLQGHDVIRMLQYNVAGMRKGDHLFQIR
jgi:hypothetical protein